MKLSGRDLYAITATSMIYLHVPFTMTTKQSLVEEELAMLEQLGARAMAARNSLVASPLGQWTPSDRQLLLASTTCQELDMSESERVLLREVLQRCLAEYGSDSAFGPLLTPGTERKDLESLLSRLT